MFDKIIGEAKGIFNTITIIEVIISLLCFLLGLLFYTNPAFSDNLVSVLTGIILIGNGIFCIYAYLKRGGIVLYNNNLVYGVILIILGLLALFLGNVLTAILGIYVGILGIQRINYGIFLKKFRESSWLLTLVVGILLIVVAVITLFTDNSMLVEVSGICLMAYGIVNFINIRLLRKRSKFFIA